MPPGANAPPLPAGGNGAGWGADGALKTGALIRPDGACGAGKPF